MNYKLKKMTIREGYCRDDKGKLIGAVSFIDEQGSLCDNEFTIRLNEKECLEITDLIADKICEQADKFTKELKKALKTKEGEK